MSDLTLPIECDPGVATMLQFFDFSHLPPNLQPASRPFCELAVTLARRLPKCAETTVAIRKLLESKDCAVRAALMLGVRSDP